MSPVLEYLGYGELPYPYTDSTFLAQAEEELEMWKDLPDSHKLASLFWLEYKCLYPEDFAPGLSMWLLSGHPIHALVAFEELEKRGQRLSPAMQKILAIATNQYLYDQLPLNNPTSKSKVEKITLQSSAVRLAAELEIYLGDPRSAACSKASSFYRDKYPDTVGISPDRLKKLLEKPPRHALRNVTEEYQSSDEKWIAFHKRALATIPDIDGSS